MIDNTLPKNWTKSHIGELVAINPPKPKVDNPDIPVTFLAMEDVSNDSKVINKKSLLYKNVEIGFTSFIDGDVLVAKITPCFENGKGALVNDLENGIGFGSTEFHVLRASEQIDARFLYYIVNTYEFRKHGEINMQGSAGQQRIPKDYIKTYQIMLPPLPEQRKIAAILSTWDEAIALTERLIAALQERKKGFMQRLLTGEVRFPGFEVEPKDTTLREAKRLTEQTAPLNWSYTFLGEVTYESKERVGQNNKHNLPVVGVNNIHGIDTNPKYFADDLSRYKVIKPGMFAYNPMRLNIGSIGYCTPKIGEGLVSPDYVVFGCNQQKIDPDFLYYCTQSDNWKSWTNKAGAGSVRVRIYYNEICRYPIILPPITEQSKIAAILLKADVEIALRKQYLESLKLQKKGLMQRLLTGEVRVMVE